MKTSVVVVLGLLVPLGLGAAAQEPRLPDIQPAEKPAAKPPEQLEKPAKKQGDRANNDKPNGDKSNGDKSENNNSDCCKKEETPPPPTITLCDRHGQVVPCRKGFEHTGAGIIDVAQPSPDTVVITMTGVAVAGCHPCKCSTAAQDFDLLQCFEVKLDKPKDRVLKLSLEGRVIGLLRSHHCGGGCAEESAACAAVVCGTTEVAAFCAPPHSVCGGENLSINDHEGPCSAVIVPGKFTLHQSFHVSASNSCHLFCCKCASAEFAPDPALDPLWISYFEPFHGAIKKDFGFQVTVKVVAE